MLKKTIDFTTPNQQFIEPTNNETMNDTLNTDNLTNASLDKMLEELGVFETLYKLAKSKDKEAITALLAKGYSISIMENKETVLMRLARENNQSAVDFLIDEFEININNAKIMSIFEPSQALLQALFGYASGGHTDQVERIMSQTKFKVACAHMHMPWIIPMIGYLYGQHYKTFEDILMSPDVNIKLAMILHEANKSHYLPGDMTIKQFLLMLANAQSNLLKLPVIPYKNDYYQFCREQYKLCQGSNLYVLRSNPTNTMHPILALSSECMAYADIEDLVNQFSEKNVQAVMKKYKLNRKQLMAWISSPELRTLVLQSDPFHEGFGSQESLRQFFLWTLIPIQFGLNSDETKELYEKMIIYTYRQLLIADLKKCKDKCPDTENKDKIESLIKYCDGDYDIYMFMQLLRQQLDQVRPNLKQNLSKSSKYGATNSLQPTAKHINSAPVLASSNNSTTPLLGIFSFLRNEPSRSASESTSLLSGQARNTQKRSPTVVPVTPSAATVKKGPYYAVVERHVTRLENVLLRNVP